MGILCKGIVRNDNITVSTWSFVKDYDKWTNGVVKSDNIVRNDNKGIVKTGMQPIVKSDTHKRHITKDNTNTVGVGDAFEIIWEDYPKKLGRKEALRHFKASVKNDKAWTDIQTALKNYNQSRSVLAGDIKYILNGSTWFNNWQDWVVSPEVGHQPKRIML